MPPRQQRKSVPVPARGLESDEDAQQSSQDGEVNVFKAAQDMLQSVRSPLEVYCVAFADASGLPEKESERREEKGY